jgi:hypothetical protein
MIMFVPGDGGISVKGLMLVGKTHSLSSKSTMTWSNWARLDGRILDVMRATNFIFLLLLVLHCSSTLMLVLCDNALSSVG